MDEPTNDLADQVAAYFKALVDRDIPEEVARHLVLDWHNAMLNHAHFVIMERNMGMKAYAKYYTGVVKNYITNVMKAPAITAPEMVDAVSKQLRAHR
jgi:hypothetical protein